MCRPLRGNQAEPWPFLRPKCLKSRQCFTPRRNSLLPLAPPPEWTSSSSAEPPQGLSSVATMRLRRGPGVVPMLIGSTWEPHRSITGPTLGPQRCSCLGRAIRLAPTTSNALKAFSVMLSLGRRANSVQLRVGDPLQCRVKSAECRMQIVRRRVTPGIDLGT